MKHLSGSDDLDLIILSRDHNAAMRLQVKVLLPAHLAGALHNVIALTRLKTLVHITAVYSVSPTLHPHPHERTAFSPAAAISSHA